MIDCKLLWINARTEVVIQRCSVKKLFLNASQKSPENTNVRVSFLIKLQDDAWNFIKKETLIQVLSSQFCEIFKNTFFAEYLRWLLLAVVAVILFYSDFCYCTWSLNINMEQI